MAQISKRERFLEYAKEIKDLGYRVFVCDDEYWNYGYVINDKDEIGYFQLGDYGCGIRFGTKHYGTRTMGDGFCIDDYGDEKSVITKKIVDRCFVRVPAHCYVPGWCRTKEEREDLERVKKYKGSEYVKTCFNHDKLVEL